MEYETARADGVEPLLAIEGLCVRYGQFQAVHDLSLTVAPGEIVSIIGANGAGKSSLLNAVMGRRPSQRASFDGTARC